MAEDLDQIETWIGGLIGKLDAGSRRKLARAIAVDLRRGQQRRIAEQRNPDGSAFAPRKKKKGLRSKTGRIKRQAMFAELRKSRYLRATATASEAAVGFGGGALTRIARVHQEGLRDRVSRKRGAPEVTYAQRVLLGFTDDDRARMADQVLAHLDL